MVSGVIMTDPLDEFKDVDLEQLIIDGLLNEIREDLNERLSHTDIYKAIEDYNNKNALQKFLQKINLGFKDCLNNFRNWKGHMRGEELDFWENLNREWDFWEILNVLNSEWSDYE